MKRGRIIPLLAMILVMSVSGCITVTPSGSDVSGKGSSGGLIAVDIDVDPFGGKITEEDTGGSDSSDEGEKIEATADVFANSGENVNSAPAQEAQDLEIQVSGISQAKEMVAGSLGMDR